MATAQKALNGHVEARLDALKADLDALQKDMRGLISDVRGVAADGMSNVVDMAVDRAGETLDRAGEWANENVDSVRSAVRKQPIAACALSMSAGALLGAFLLRR